MDFVLFDLGGVLVDVDESRSRARWEALDLPRDRYAAAFHASGAKADADLGVVDAEGMRQRVEAAAGAAVDTRTLHEVWGAVVAWRPWVSGLLARLTTPYGVLSTIDPVHASVLGPLPGADPLLYSYAIRAVKPDPRAFEVAIARVSRPPSRIRYVDDRPDNVRAARRAGLDAVVTTDRSSVERALAPLLREPSAS